MSSSFSMSEISRSPDYISFRSTVSQKKVVVDSDSSKEWKLYDAGPRHIRCPLVCLPPASGSADVFFRQLLSLSALGYRVIALEYPKYWTMNEWCDGFRKLLDTLHLDRVHIFGASLGGFLAQKFAEVTFRSQRVQSLFLCNSFIDTAVFQQSDSASMFWIMPSLLLKKMVMWTFDDAVVDAEIADSIDFMVEKLEGLSQSELASRLTLNCLDSYVQPQKLQNLDITIMDVFDNCVISQNVKEEIYKCYPDAKRAHLKTGGNFPYLSRSAEVTLHIRIHLRKFEGTRYSAKEELEQPVNNSFGTSSKIQN